MADDLQQDVKDAWQFTTLDAPCHFAIALQELHRTNPWPELSLLERAINALATELWDRGFSVTEITSALSKAAADLPRYAGGIEVRS